MTLFNVAQNDTTAVESILQNSSKRSVDSSSDRKDFDQFLTAKKNQNNVKKTEQSKAKASKPQKAEREKQSPDETAIVSETETKKETPATEASKPVAEEKTTQAMADNGQDEQPLVTTDAEEEIVALIAAICNIPIETVTQWLKELNLSPLALTDPQTANMFLQKVLEIDTPAMLLKTPDFQPMLEAVNQALEPFQPLAEAVANQTLPEALKGLQVVREGGNQPVVLSADATVPEPATNQTELAPATVTVEKPAEELLDSEIIPEETTADETINTEHKTEQPQQDASQQDASQQEDPQQGASPYTTDSGSTSQQQPEAEVKPLDIDVLPVSVPNTPMESVAAVKSQVVQGTAQAASVDANDVLNQIMSRVRVNTGDQFTELRLTLKPENLGDVTLRVATQNGIVMAQFVAENQRVKEIIESNFNQLKDALQQQGLQISELSVSVGQDDSERMNQFQRAQQNSRVRMRRVQGVEADMTVPEENIVNPAEVWQNSIDFTA